MDAQSILEFFGAAVTLALTRLLALLIALRGTRPKDRPAIILALSDLFKIVPRRHPVATSDHTPTSEHQQ